MYYKKKSWIWHTFLGSRKLSHHDSPFLSFSSISDQDTMASIQSDGIGPEKGTKNKKQWYKKLGKLKKKKIQNDPFKNLLVIESPQSLLFNHANREKILSGQLLGHVFDIVDSSLFF